MSINKAVVVNNGGLHSTTAVAVAADRGYEVYSISFDYGNPFKLTAARKAVASLKVKDSRFVKVDLPGYKGPGKPGDATATSYIPARNAIFMSYALSWAEEIAAHHIFIAVNTIHYGAYPDCTPDFIHSYEHMGNTSTIKACEGMPLNIWAPLMKQERGAFVARGTALGVKYEDTHSCYTPAPDGTACGTCGGCKYRKAAFAEAGVKDPTKYIS